MHIGDFRTAAGLKSNTWPHFTTIPALAATGDLKAFI
jgi:hypothetical protein